MVKLIKFMFLCGVFSIVGLIVLSSIFSPKSTVDTSSQNLVKSVTTDIKSNATVNTIPDLMPVDVYLSMEKRGYKTDFDAKNYIWSSTKEIGSVLGHDGAIYYLVEVSSQNTDSVSRVNARITVTKKDTSAIALPELLFVASVPYKGSDPQKAQEWVRQNIGKKSKTVIGGVIFEIDAPATTSRSLSIYVKQ
jgi:hypothetical protein